MPNYLIALLPLARPEAAASLESSQLSRPDINLGLARLIHNWHQQWGAEPVVFSGISMSFEVNRPPQTIDDAIPLAIEHAAVGPYVLDGPGISVYEYAYTLVGATRWEPLDLP